MWIYLSNTSATTTTGDLTIVRHEQVIRIKTLGRLTAVSALALSVLAVSTHEVRAQEGVTDARQDTISGDYPLQPGDAIRLAFWREQELSGEYPVDENGAIVLPILGHRNVTGIPAATLKNQLLEEYGEQLRNQEVQVTLLRRVRVLGAVDEPGLYYVDPTMTLGDAIALAGGATSDGKLDDIKIFRNGEEIRSDLDSTVRVMDEVQSGDQVLVPQRSWFNRNGAIIVASMVTATALILIASF
jgi:polysaccharide export outer membrane protein